MDEFDDIVIKSEIENISKRINSVLKKVEEITVESSDESSTDVSTDDAEKL